MQDPTDIHAQERAQAEADELARREKEEEDADFRWLMSSRRGRRIVWRLLRNVDQPSFNTNAMVMSFKEGRRYEGMRLKAMLEELCPEMLITMFRENSERLNDRRNAEAGTREDS